MLNTKEMIYRNLGKSGLMVSAISFGTWTNTDVTYEQNKQIITKCLQNGVNCFDLGELYGQGSVEQKFGTIIKELSIPREQLVITTKIWKSKDADINSNCNTNLKHIRQGLNKSLKRLQMDYVDIILSHHFDPQTSIQEICRGFNYLIDEGLSFYWGIANWNASKIFEAFQVCNKNNWHVPIVAQNQYNMICRSEVQSDFRKLFEEYQLGLMAYSPLMGGFLSGKYLDKESSGRFSDQKTGGMQKQQLAQFYFHQNDQTTINNTLKQLKKIAEEYLKCTLVQLAIAWVLKFEYTSTALIGARNEKQLDNTFRSIKVMNLLTNQLQGKINKLLNTHPEARMNWKMIGASEHLRPIQQQKK